jgi:hypothetical protein
MQIYADLDPDPQHCKKHTYEGANPDPNPFFHPGSKNQGSKMHCIMYPRSHYRINHWIFAFLLKVNFNTNLFQVTGSPIPPPCHPRHRCGLAAEMWPVPCLHCSVQVSGTRTAMACRQFRQFLPYHSDCQCDGATSSQQTLKKH